MATTLPAAMTVLPKQCSDSARLIDHRFLLEWAPIIIYFETYFTEISLSNKIS